MHNAVILQYMDTVYRYLYHDCKCLLFCNSLFLLRYSCMPDVWDGRILKLFIDVEIIRQGGLTYVSIRDRLSRIDENRKRERRNKKQVESR